MSNTLVRSLPRAFVRPSHLLLASGLLLGSGIPALSEGSHQTETDQALEEYEAVRGNAISVYVIAGEYINVSVLGEAAGDTVAIRILDPGGTQVLNVSEVGGNIPVGERGMNGSLSTPRRLLAAQTGQYEVQLTNTTSGQDQIQLFDISVTPDNTTLPDATTAAGRVSAVSWTFNASSFDSAFATDADFFALVPGGVPNTNYVWKLDLNAFAGFAYVISANQIGVDAPRSGLSTLSSGNSYSPLYPVYLSYPSVALPEPMTPPVLSNVFFEDSNGNDISISPGTSAGIEDSGTFNFDSSTPGSYSIFIDSNKDGIESPGDVILIGPATMGTNSVVWDGTDNTGAVLAVDQYAVEVSVRLGEYHFIADDAETSGGRLFDGLTIHRMTSASTEVATTVYWDDETLLGGDSNVPVGELAGLHSWGMFTQTSFGDQKYIDTFVFGLTGESDTQVVIANDDDPLTDADNDGTFDDYDLDNDNDGISDVDEGNGDLDQDGIPNRLDLDSDGDGIADLVEAGGTDSNGDGRVDGFTDANTDGFDDTLALTPLADPNTDGTGGPDRVDIDSDGDGIVDNVEGQTSAAFQAPLGSDGDSDGWDDRYDSDDGGMAISLSNKDGFGLLDYRDLDSDEDGLPDSVEGHDADMDGLADTTAAGTDADGDGLDDAYDTVVLPAAGNPNGSNAPLQNTDSDSEPDFRDADDDGDGTSTADEDTNNNGNWRDDDEDGDGVPDYLDALDSDRDGIPDKDDLDDDGDGILDTVEGGGDLDSDGLINSLDIDSDGDGIVDNVEAQATGTYVAPSGNDTDLDGLDDAYDTDNSGTTIAPVNTDTFGNDDYLDTDADDDGVLDAIEGHDADQDGVADVSPSGNDADNDGLDDAYDTVVLPAAGNGTGSNAPLQNTDADAEPDWRDEDDDGDGVDTVDEDTDGMGGVANDDEDGDGIPDYLDGDDTDSDGIPNSLDGDDDNDGVPDASEGSGAVDTDGDGIVDSRDTDSDGDGLPDLVEAGGPDTDGDGKVDGFTDSNDDGIDDTLAGMPLDDPNTDGAGGPDRQDIDSDGDGIVDNVEAQATAVSEAPLGTDTDMDGWDDRYDSDDGGTAIVITNTGGTAAPDYLDTDSDGDGVPDLIEGHDADEDGVPDQAPAGADADGDGLDDAFDTVVLPGVGNATGSNAALQNTDADAEPNWRDTDDDGDGIDTADQDGNNNGDWSDDDIDMDGTPDYLDNDDMDGDGIPDATDLDDDGDGIPDSVEGSLDFDMDGRIDSLDIDSDDDGIPDNVEAQSTAAFLAPLGVDTDMDGLDDRYDLDDGGTPIVLVNTDGADGFDYLDTDSDDDSVPDAIEGHDANTDGIADVIASNSDTDDDGLDDAFDSIIRPAAGNANGSNAPLQNTDGDAEPNWRDVDDDGDGVDTIDEDTDTSGDPADDDDDGDGIPDYLDGDDTDGDGRPDSLDGDDDNDGLPDSAEGNGAVDTDGDGIPDSRDLDSDGDGLADLVEAGGVDANGDGVLDSFTDLNDDGVDDTIAGNPLTDPNTDGVGGPDRTDLDADGDGITDNVEAQAGGVYQAPSGNDTDSDGLDDSYDSDDGGTPIVIVNSGGAAAPDYLDDDSDGDGVPDSIEGHDANLDGVADVTPSGIDDDGDGIDNVFDTFAGPGLGSATGSNAAVQNTGGDPAPDYRDDDDDGDGLSTASEDTNMNGDWSDDDRDGDGTPNYLDTDDADGDGIEDGVDLDDDNDGIPDSQEGDDSVDTDGDGIPDLRDLDSDGDGVPDAVEAGGTVGSDGRLDGFVDANMDGLDDGLAGNPLTLVDTDGDGHLDHRDLDADGDGIPDVVEAGSSDADGDGRVDGAVDANRDGYDDAITAAPLTDPNSDGTGGPDRLDIDADDDGIVDGVEAQPSNDFRAPTGVDTDMDGWDDRYDDDDGGVAFTPQNTDGAGPADYRDEDSDDDGVLDSIEGHDGNSDGVADRSRSGTDADGDGLDDAFDTLAGPDPGNSAGGNADLQDSEGDGQPDWRDDDDDGDGVLTISEDANGNGDRADDDANGDGSPNYLDGASTLLEVAKVGIDLNGAPLQAGDEVEYSIVVQNLTTADATGVNLRDGMPANTLYTLGSTTLNGVTLTDVAGISPLVDGVDVQSPGSAAALVEAGGSAEVRFRVSVDDSAVAGSRIMNSATLRGTDSLTSTTFSEVSDDPSTEEADDPTVQTVGDAPDVIVTLEAEDENGGDLLANEVITYTVRVRNRGTAGATGLMLTDLVPDGTTFVPGSITFDEDGSGPGGSVPLTDAVDGDEADFGGTLGDAVTTVLPDLDPDEDVFVMFQVTVDGAAVSGDLVSHQATLASDEQPDVKSDADQDPTNGEQPTRLIVGSEPALRLVMAVSDVNGGTTQPGDVLEYRLVLTNDGAAEATNVFVQNPFPIGNTAYLLGSTALNGALLADDAGPQSPLETGVTLPSVQPGESVTFVYRVAVDGSANQGDQIVNQATYAADGGLSGVSDSDADEGLESGNDPMDPNDDDPLVVTLGGATGSASLTGFTWQDFDHDRVQGLGEPVVPGFLVELLQDGTLLDTTETNIDGAWTFTGLLPGSGYQLRFRDPESGAVWGSPVSNIPGSTVNGGLIEDIVLSSGAAFADIGLPLDPSGVVYDSISRLPITGATLTLVGPVGFDPAIHLPSGQQGQVSGADGRYRFDLLAGFPDGNYTIEMRVPSGYSPLYPSVTIPPTAGPLDPTGNPDPFLVVPNSEAPVGAEPTTYYLSFDLAAGDPNVLNNHIPLDALAGAPISVVKSSPKNRARIGEIVPFRIQATNNLSGAITGYRIVDTLPAGFKFVTGSAQLDGVAIEPRDGTRSQRLVFEGVDFAADQTRAITLLAVVGSGVQRGVFVNRAHVEDDSGTIYSNVGEATVLVVPDPLFEQSDVIGQVYLDLNGNGYQDDGEEGVAGITLVTIRGLRVTTDPFGRYHVARPEDPTPTIGSNFILKVDPTTLPAGYEITSENPRVIRMTAGKVHKVNFGVRPVEGVIAGTEQTLLVTAAARHPRQEGEGESLSEARLASAQEGESAGDSARALPETAEERESLIERLGVAAADPEFNALDLRVRAESFASGTAGGEPRLNVAVQHAVVKAGEIVRFYAFSDYEQWIERAEIRVFADGTSTRGKPLFVGPMLFGADGAPWSTQGIEPGVLRYVLRVTAADGAFDETDARTLTLTEEEPERQHELDGVDEPEQWPGYGEGARLLANIEVKGARVTVDGRDVPKGHVAKVLGRKVPVGENGRFATTQWVSFGEHDVTVTVAPSDGAGSATTIRRKLYVPEDNWFFVGLADLTIGTSSADASADLLSGEGGLITDATGSAFDDKLYVNGRLAFYLKGVINGETLLTAALDTRDQPLEDILKGLDAKDPQSLFRRIQPGEVYAVYGDSSTTTEDAPTQGKFYVRIEHEGATAVWGNFKSGFLDTDFAQVDRALYGARVHWDSEERTSRGDDRVSVDVFAASPDTVAARDELQGTGGTVYFLRNQDLTVGSERLRVEVRDRDSGIVIGTRALVPFTDYTIDYIQGRVVMVRPLETVVEDGQLVQSGSLNGDPVVLVARYEHTPSFTDTNNMALGARVEGWANDRFKVGVTASREEQLGDKTSLVGADVTYRHSDHSYVKAEIAQTDGPGTASTGSFDGGFTFGSNATGANGSATGVRLEGEVDFSDLSDNSAGSARFYLQDRGAGYSAPGQLTGVDTTQWGVDVTAPIDEKTSVRAKIDEIDREIGTSNRAIDLDVTRTINDRWSATFGGRMTQVDGASQGESVRSGDRTDLAARFNYTPEDSDWAAWAFGQFSASVDASRSDNNRVGVGARKRFSDRVAVNGELSVGDGGLGLAAGIEYDLSDRTRVYLNALANSDRSDAGLGNRQNGNFAAGVKSRFTDEVTIFAEERVTRGQGQTGLSHAFGVDLVPTDRWNISAFMEVGELSQPGAPQLDRTSTTLSGSYAGDDWKYGGAVEFRMDETPTIDRDVWVFKNNLSRRLDEEWTGLAELNVLRSDDSSGAFFDGEFTEALLGFAFRPTDNDRWNSLFTYRYLEDSPTSGQVAATGTGDLYQQRSHVLAVDSTWQATERLALGGKYAVRASELRTEALPWFESVAQLVIARGNYHVVHNWDALVELRWTDVDLAEDRSYGVLAAVYRHLGDNGKLGVGYNFTDFSDDITDLSYNARGIFVNLVGKF